MIFTLNMLFEKLCEYDFIIEDDNVLSREYNSFHLLPENESYYRSDIVYLTDSYDMPRFNTFKRTQEHGGKYCLIYVYEKDDDYVDGASIYIKTPTELAIVLNRMQEFIIDLIMLEHDLNDAIIKKASVQEILNAIHSMIQKPMVLIGPSMKLIAHAETNIPDIPTYQELISNGYITNNSSFTSPDKKYNICSANFAYSIVQDKSGDYEIHYLIKVTGSISILLCCIVSTEHYTGSILSMLHLFAPYLRQCLAQDEQIATSNIYESLVADILSCKISAIEAKSRCQALGIKFEGNFMVLCIDFSNASSSADIVCGNIHLAFTNSMPLIYEHHIIVIINCLSNKIAEIQDCISDMCRSVNLVCGISHVFHRMSEAATAYTQAEAAITIGQLITNSRFVRHFNIPMQLSSNQIYIYANIAEFHAYYLASSQIDYRNFCLPEILDLVDQSYESHANIIAILYAYITNGCSYVETARLLFMHRNNVVYHINRLKETLHLPITDSRYIQQLITTYHMLILRWGEGVFVHLKSQLSCINEACSSQDNVVITL